MSKGIVAKQQIFNGTGWDDLRIQSNSVDMGQAVSLATTNATNAAARACALGCYVSAPIANTKPIYVGFGVGVTTTTGVELNAGDREWFPVANTSQLWLITGTATQAVNILAC